MNLHRILFFAASIALFGACNKADSDGAQGGSCIVSPNEVESLRKSHCGGRECGDVSFIDRCNDTHVKSCGGCASSHVCGASGQCACDTSQNEALLQAACGDRVCGDVSFEDVCRATHVESCGACQTGWCTAEGRCSECDADVDCPAGYRCDRDLSGCVQRDDYCEVTTDCPEGFECTDKLCTGENSCKATDLCPGDAQCLNGICKDIAPIEDCSATGSTTRASTVLAAVAGLTGPESIHSYEAQKGELISFEVTPLDRTYDPAVYVLSQLVPSPILVPVGDEGAATAVDDHAGGCTESLIFTAAEEGTYYFVISSDPAKQAGANKEGRYTLCLGSDVWDACSSGQCEVASKKCDGE